MTEQIKPKKKWYQYSVINTLLITIAVLFIFNIFFTFVGVNGISMEPTFMNGEIHIAKRWFSIDRFDVVVIDAYDVANTTLIKRVIGLPNETVEYKNNQLYINGQLIEDNYGNGDTEDFIITLKDDEYFVLGDNRIESWDSRIYGTFSKDLIFAELFKRGG